jgi:hypothetical protein
MAANGAGEWASCERTQSDGEEDGGPVQQRKYQRLAAKRSALSIQKKRTHCQSSTPDD